MGAEKSLRLHATHLAAVRRDAHAVPLHWETIVALTLFSLLLCYARLRSNSLALPIFLHTLIT